MSSGLSNVYTDSSGGEVMTVADFIFRDVQALLSTISPMHRQTGSNERMRNRGEVGGTREPGKKT